MKPAALSMSLRSSGGRFTDAGYEEIFVPAIWEQAPFVAKGGAEIISQMYAFPDKKGREVCLMPEVTGPLQQVWRENWAKESSSPLRVFYVSRCYRYDRPQANRYREFTQVGVELLGTTSNEALSEVKELLLTALDATGVGYKFDASVKRGLGYYTDLGFEASCPGLGSQKQIAGGGRYPEGVGWAVGLDRLVAALKGGEPNPPAT